MILSTSLKKWCVEPVESILLQVPRALVASALAAILDFGTLVFLVEIPGWHPIPAAVVGYLAGGILQYFLCALWVFPACPASATVGFAAFTVLSLFGLGITWISMAVLYDGFQLAYTFAKCVALGLAFSWNFLSRKFLLFRPKSQGEFASVQS